MATELNFVRAPYLGQVVLVIDHAPDEKVRLKLAEAEECFSSLISAQAKSSNVDDSSAPDVPRLVLNGNHKSLSLAKTRMQLSLNFEPGFDIDKAFNAIRKSASEFFTAASRFQTLNNRTQIGFVLHINQPCEESTEQCAQYLSEAFYSGATLGSIATFQIRFGFKTSNDLYKNFAFNIYQLKELNLPSTQNGRVVVNIAQIPTKEFGIETILDINNKPRIRDNITSQDDLGIEQTGKELIEEMHTMLATERHSIFPMKNVESKG